MVEEKTGNLITSSLNSFIEELKPTIIYKLINGWLVATDTKKAILHYNKAILHYNICLLEKTNAEI